MKTQGPIEGVKSKGKALIKVVNVSFKYPRNDKVTIEKATVQVSLSSRVACIGPNGAGKSTLIKCDRGVPRRCGAFTPSKLFVSRNDGSEWFLFRFRVHLDCFDGNAPRRCLTGEVQPTTGTVWQHPNARIGYIAQHAFHHIEQ